MKFIADLHVHSKYSRATAANLDLENLYITAQIKGISLIATGDFTHPAWWQEIREKLEPAQEGLFKLKKEFAKTCDLSVPGACRQPVRFILVTEISNIYKKDERTRKNHNLVFMPDMTSAERLNKRLEAIGNIHSDGRPILGLDARNLLEIVLETHEQAFLVPAHIWTPWFSLLGSKSGFDAVEHCFGDLTPHIFALETGLSSDPPMNRRISSLDRYTLISNSDAHSPSKLGREANCFDTELSYGAIHSALKTGDPQKFLGTLEFYPEEGKYHVDGHRKCGFRCQPEETRRLGGLCPKCGKPLTLGVLYRVESLADRSPEEPPAETAPYRSLIPLTDLLSEIFKVGPKTKKVTRAYDQLIQKYGSELGILCDTPLDAYEKCGIPLLGESIRRMRSHELNFDPGYDGEFGRVRLFSPGERQILQGQRCLFAVPNEKSAPNRSIRIKEIRPLKDSPNTPRPVLFEIDDAHGLRLNNEQQLAVDHGKGPLIISAGPGTGKTRTITCRMAAILEKQTIRAENMVAMTFTHQAAEEMRQRLAGMLPPAAELPMVATFHGFCLHLLQEAYKNRIGAVLDEFGRRAIIEDALGVAQLTGHTVSLSTDAMAGYIVRAKQQLLGPKDDLTEVVDNNDRFQATLIYAVYQRLLKIEGLFDFEGLIFHVVDLLKKDRSWRKVLQGRFSYIFVDEFQDINMAQYQLLQALAPQGSNLCVIGDPDQAIYGFRGSDARYFRRICHDYTAVRSVSLKKNYRSTETILNAAFQVIGDRNGLSSDNHRRTYSGIQGVPTVTIVETASERSEAVIIGRTIEQMVGGIGFHSIDFGKIEKNKGQTDATFDDFGILCRTGQQARLIADRLISSGIPCQLVSKHLWAESVVLKLLAAFRVVSGRGAYVDLNFLIGLSAAGISKKTLSIFKQWAYSKQLPMATAVNTARRIPIPGMSHRRQIRLVALFDLLETLRKATAGMDAAKTLKFIAVHTTLSAQITPDILQKVVEQALAYGHKSGVFVDTLALQHDTDIYRAGIEKVAVMTMHASKGLEFSTVFVAGCEAGLIPYQRPGSKMADIEEERRLFYVAMTRARKQLYCTWARKRSIHGKTREQQLSPFLAAIEKKLKTHIAYQSNPRHPPQEQMSLF